MSDLSSLQRAVEAEARRLFPGAVRRVEWLRHGDAPVIEPGEIMPRFVLASPAGAHGSHDKHMLKAFQDAHRPALRQFRLELARRWPQIRHIGVTFEDESGGRDGRDGRGGGMIQALDDEHGPQGHGRGVPVTVRLEADELATADRLITAGVAASRAEALRWALGRAAEAGPGSDG